MKKTQIYALVNKFKEADEEVILSQPRSGRPPKLTPSIKKMITKYYQGQLGREVRQMAVIKRC